MLRGALNLTSGESTVNMKRQVRTAMSGRTRRARQAGFTLLELVVVIVIVGILAAVAVPKFTSLTADARAGVIKGVSGAMASANIAVYAAAVSQGEAGKLLGSVSACGGTIATAYGYAADSNNTTGLGKCVDLNPALDFTVVTGAIQHARASAGTTCQAGYTAPSGAGLQPTYLTAVSDCS